MDSNLINLIFILVSILIGISLHEFMHAFSSYLLGDDTAKSMGRISINPLKHIDPVTTVAMPALLFMVGLPPLGAAKPVIFNPARLKFGEYGMGIVAIAGPLTNLALALIGAGIYHLFLVGSGVSTYVIDFVLIFSYLNVVFFAFNMIPIPPLDGSRVLYVFSPDGVRDILNLIEKFGILVILVLVMMASPFIGSYITWVLELFSLPL